MPCKTRQAALRGERSKPHYFLAYPKKKNRHFGLANGPGQFFLHGFTAEQALQAFEARIDWSTWGRSR